MPGSAGQRAGEGSGLSSVLAAFGAGVDGLAAWAGQGTGSMGLAMLQQCHSLHSSVSTAVFQLQVTSDELSGLVSLRGQCLMGGEMLEAGLAERETACGNVQGRKSSAWIFHPSRDGSCWDGDVGSSCVLADSGTTSLQRSRRVKRRTHWGQN